MNEQNDFNFQRGNSELESAAPDSAAAAQHEKNNDTAEASRNEVVNSAEVVNSSEFVNGTEVVNSTVEAQRHDTVPLPRDDDNPRALPELPLIESVSQGSKPHSPAGTSVDPSPLAPLPQLPPLPQFGVPDGTQLGKDAGRSRQRTPWAAIVATAAATALVAGSLASLITGQIVGQQPASAGNPAQQAQPATPATSPSDWSSVAQKVEPSVVAIQVVDGESRGSQGSGVVWDDQGHIVTNNHVIHGASPDGVVVIVGNNTYAASIVGGDAATDIAVLKLERVPDGLTPIQHGNSDSLVVGQEVAAIGNPLGLSGSVTTGIVSALDRPIATGGSSTKPVITNAIQTSAPLNPGNSGGALVDRNGALIGINSAIASVNSADSGKQSGNIGIGFAIPISLTENIASQLIENGKVSHAFLGTATVDGAVQVDGEQRLGAEVKTVVPDGPSEHAGLEVGDVIVTLDGHEILGSQHLVGTVRTLKVDQQVTMQVVRDGKRVDLEVTLGTAPDL